MEVGAVGGEENDHGLALLSILSSLGAKYVLTRVQSIN